MSLTLQECFQGEDTQGASHGHGHFEEQAGGAHGEHCRPSHSLFDKGLVHKKSLEMEIGGKGDKSNSLSKQKTFQQTNC